MSNSRNEEVKNGSEAGDIKQESPSPDQNEDQKALRASRLHARISNLEQRVGDIEVRGSDESETEENEDEKDVDLKFPESVIPKVRWCNWHQFKNRYSEEEGSYAIEVLMAHPAFPQEVLKESHRRAPTEAKKESISALMRENITRREGTTYSAKEWIARVRIQSPVVLQALSKISSLPKAWESRPHTFASPFRHLMYNQDKMKNELAVVESMQQQQQQQRQRKSVSRSTSSASAYVEQKTTDRSTTSSESSSDSGSQSSATEPENENDANTDTITPMTADEDDDDESGKRDGTCSDDKVDGNEKKSEKENQNQNEDEDEHPWAEHYRKPGSLEEMRCYVDFVEEHLMPLYRRFDDVDPTKPYKIRHKELWNIFRFGEVLYYPPPPADLLTSLSKETRDELTGRHKLWRVYKLLPPRIDCDEAGEFQVDTDSSALPANMQVWCYYIDHDGKDWGAMTDIIRIYEYPGEKDVRELDIYPLRFHADREKILREAKELGQKVVASTEQKHVAYNGWTVIKDPLSNPYQTASGTDMTSPDHIDSHIVIDAREAFNVFPSWAPTFETYSEYGIQTSTVTDKYAVHTWADAKRTTALGKLSEIVVDDDDTDSFEYNVNLKGDRFIRQSGNDKPPLSPHATFEGDDFALLPPRVFAYALRERKFFPVDVRNVQPVAEQLDAFQYLQIEESHRRMITSLTSAHFRKKAIEKKTGRIVTQDIIRGKGRGIVILLHGSPGIGKTATAEAVSLAHKKPLFPITCGDLGFTPQSVESSLGEIFRLAHLWDCVLLLDEADVFLSQRTKEDLQRNALVSVFLRILEYYNGILFLTTNRPGTLDEAVKSRVHVSLYYKPLGVRETENIFKMNIDRLEETEKILSDAGGDQPLYIFKDQILAFAREHYWRHQHGMGRWNGRQIRNAFLIAASLAHNDAEEHPGAQKQLKASHFQLVEDATLNFDQFRAQVLGKVDGEIALEREERFDGFQPAPVPERQAYYGPPDHMHASRGAPYGAANRHEYRRPPMPGHQQGYPSPPPPSHAHAHGGGGGGSGGAATSPYSGAHTRYGSQQQQLHAPSSYNPQTPTTSRAGLTPSPSHVSGPGTDAASAEYRYGSWGPQEHGYGQQEAPHNGPYQQHPPYDRDPAAPRGPPGADGPPSRYDTPSHAPTRATPHPGPEHTPGHNRSVSRGREYFSPSPGMEPTPPQGY
ncbi:hypothetical protein SODALDRAFT_327228 [Sodiomyces alkalinus F11]|uniref:AAA+ ATPase domain-containing protein n=1 Tax=Sodiomyces alkalinus (strain CBS 110278 / VKM F-3762 / F11) TaxID=1314773 RepID=A0A3N2Q8G4_SODAK|nr:hypothetical protein SODALDRAFT_327228 [Sodiomyces alkalinus F11]ROT43063.1 hypothetical protein SODALDRAFT_327228 [Sodiomyces alkalinus F11]